MDSKIFGIPLVLIVLVAAIILGVLGPYVLLRSVDYRISQSHFARLESTQREEVNELVKIETLLRPTPTATPEATVTPFQSKASFVVTPTKTK